MRSIWTVLTVVCLAATVRGTAAAQLAPASPIVRTNRVRALGPTAQALIDDGTRQSSSFTSLLQAVERSDLIVYVATGFLRVTGRLEFASAKAGTRYLRVTVNVPDAEPRLIASLAHELQHAAEIAAAPEVTDAAALARYYQQHGQRVSRDEYCTRAAQRVTDAVRLEIGAAAGRRRSHAGLSCGHRSSRFDPRATPLRSSRLTPSLPGPMVLPAIRVSSQLSFDASGGWPLIRTGPRHARRAAFCHRPTRDCPVSARVTHVPSRAVSHSTWTQIQANECGREVTGRLEVNA